MKQTPILMSPDLAQKAHLGLKTVTRRPIKGIDSAWEIKDTADDGRQTLFVHPSGVQKVVRCPYGGPGDLLWVRENWKLIGWDWEDCVRKIMWSDGSEGWMDEAEDFDPDWLVRETNRIEKSRGVEIIRDPGGDEEKDRFKFDGKDLPWRPNIFLPKWAARTWLKIVSVRAERVQDITNDDAFFREGIEANERERRLMSDPYRQAFRRVWNQLYDQPGETWAANPWVWVIHYEKTEAPRG